MTTRPSSRKRRSLRQLEELPGLFDGLEIDMTRQMSIPEKTEPTAPAKASQASQPENIDINPEALRSPDTIRFISFGSGSSGNCAYIGSREGGMLIDAGVDSKIVMEQLAENSINPRNIAGIVLTHDHSDHVRYAYQLLRANRHMLLYCTPRTLNGLLRRHSISRRIKDYHKAIYKEFEFTAAGFTITPFETSHDGSDNAGFCFQRGDQTFVVATDMGCITERADHYMRLANYLMLESNYDKEMLINGQYPEYLKARIMGDRGHLDNSDAAAFVLNAAQSQASPLSHLFLCHLSEDNNTPEKALECLRRTLEQNGISVGDAAGSPMAQEAQIRITALPRFTSSYLFVLRK